MRTSVRVVVRFNWGSQQMADVSACGACVLIRWGRAHKYALQDAGTPDIRSIVSAPQGRAGLTGGANERLRCIRHASTAPASRYHMSQG